MAVEWTKKQKDVIDTRGRNILVSAAAGSGKTAVLVERIIQKILDKENPVDVDKLLVVTFTKAAAAEMRERVLEALEKALAANPDDEHLQKQQTYIHNAKITTIDSFCAQIVREYFDKTKLDPNTRIVDEAEMKMLESDVLEEMLEEYFESGSREFFSLADKYTDPKNTGTLNEIIVTLYKAAASHVNPKGWLNECRNAYNVTDATDAESMTWMIKLKSILSIEIKEMLGKADEALRLCSEDDGPDKYYDDIAGIRQKLLQVDCTKPYNEIRALVNKIEFSRLPAIKKDSCDEKLKEQVKNFRDDIKKKLATVKKDLLPQSVEEMVYDISQSWEMVDTLINLTLDFYDRFANEKVEKCIMDFADQEHYALKILVDFHEDGSMSPSATALEIAQQFEEIMIDEYQDSNYIQEAILTSISKGSGVNNVFMVGDVKQSIYKFRLANPNLFIEKYDTYEEDLTKDKCKIILDKNFRSRKEIIDSVNYIFNNIMHKSLGGIDYEDGNELSFGAEYYPELPEGQDNSTELILVDGSGNENEARVIAHKIKMLVDSSNNFKVTGKDGNFRTPQYKDIVILLRSVKNRADEYVKILSQEGIPAYCESRTGYYQAKEVKTILNYLRIIDNPLQDIPFAAIMRSEIYKFTSEELAIIKSHNSCNYYYDCVRLYAENGEDEKLKDKIKKMLCEIQYYRSIVPYTNVYDLLTLILSKTGYGNYISALPNGIRRIKNIDILKEKAISYDAGAYKGLFNFVRYIEKIEELGMDEGEASFVNENDNIVRIMTFHKSKGLQFPIVFVSGLGTKFNNSDTTGKIAIHEKYGIGTDFIDDDYRVKKSTIIKNVINKVIKEENYAEYIRFLYVALTRAQEKMILTASKDKMESKIASWLSYRNGMDSKVSYGKLMDADSMIEWIGFAVSKNKGFDRVTKLAGEVPKLLNPSYREDSKITADWIREDEIEILDTITTFNEDLRKNQLESMDKNVVYDNEVKNTINQNLSWKYKYVNNFLIPAKLSVTEIKKLNMEYNEEEDGAKLFVADDSIGELPEIIPDFIRENSGIKKTFKGAEKGTAYHKIFELFDFGVEPTEENIEKMIAGFVESGRMSSDAANCIEIKDFVIFTKSDLYSRMKHAYENNKLYRERKFMMGIPARNIYKDSDSDETILVQGIIDACFEEDGKYIIVDYKTDNVNRIEELADRYKTQLESYKEAVNMLEISENKAQGENKVGEKIIYSVKLGEEISL